MLRTTPYRRSGRGQRDTSGPFRTATAAVMLAGVVGLAACGSSSSTSTTAAAVAAYQKDGNAICTQAVAAISPVTSRMDAVEKNKHLPTLADTKALDSAQAKLQKDLAALTPPASLQANATKMKEDFAAVVARVQALLKQHGSESIAYDAIDPQLASLTATLDGDLKALGLTSCV